MGGMTAMPRMPERPFGIPMTRMGSGTAWLPDASAMELALGLHPLAKLYAAFDMSVRHTGVAGSCDKAHELAVVVVPSSGSGVPHPPREIA